MADQSVAVIAEIRLNATGEIRESRHTLSMGDGERHPRHFGWSEGNFACDCNRAIFFYADEDEPDRECDENAFSVRLRDAGSGAVFYDEIEVPRV